MMAKGTVVGVFTVDRAFSGGSITSEDMRNLSMLANQTGLAIENSRLYKYIETVNRELSQARERLAGNLASSLNAGITIERRGT